MYKFKLVTILVFTCLYIFGQAEYGIGIIYTKTFEDNLGRFVDNEGYPKYENCILDSIANQSQSSKYFYREGKLHVVNNYYNNDLSIARLKYTNGTLKLNRTTHTELGSTYDITYIFDSLDRVVHHSSEFSSIYSTTSENCSYDYAENNKLDKITCHTDYQGGLSLESTTTVGYIYENEKVKTEYYEDVTFAPVSGTSTTEYKTNYEHVGDTIIIKKGNIVEYRLFSEPDGSSGNYKTIIEENEEGNWDHFRTIIYKANGLPMSVTNKHGNVENYYYVSKGEEYDDPDGDGYIGSLDCDESDPEINAGQSEIRYNGKDDDCNSSTLDDDIDQDGFALAEDCNDLNFNVNPNQIEIPYNGLDEDCDVTTLDDDLDQDGFVLEEDCDDNNPGISPNQTETPYNGLDDDCNVTTLDDDLDQDGFALAEDCDDNNASINPGAEEIPNNDIDEDCDGMDLLSSIHELANVTLSIYPNPAIDIVNIEVDGNISYSVSLYDTEGRQIVNEMNSSKIQIHALPAGTYLVEIIEIATGHKIVEQVVKSEQ